MTLPGTIPENLLSHEWGQWLEQYLRSFQPLAECWNFEYWLTFVVHVGTHVSILSALKKQRPQNQ